MGVYTSWIHIYSLSLSLYLSDNNRSVGVKFISSHIYRNPNTDNVKLRLPELVVDISSYVYLEDDSYYSYTIIMVTHTWCLTGGDGVRLSYNGSINLHNCVIT